MRICIVMEYHPDDLVGGAEIQVFGVAKQLAALGHEVTYLCQRYNRARPLDETVAGVRVLRALRWHKVFRFVLAPRVFWMLLRIRPDVVYQRSAQYLTGLVGYSARILSVPFVWACSQDESLEPGFLVRWQTTSAGRKQGLKGRLLARNARINQRLFYAGLRSAGALIVQNSRQLELLQRNFGRSAQVIPNGIESKPRQTPRSPNPLVLWLNRVSVGKNAEGFIELARSLETECPGTRFVLVGGRQPDGYMERITRSASGVSNLEMTGMVRPDQTQTWFEQAWVYVLTSVDEGFPNVLLQAWAAGVPVVSLEVDPDGLIGTLGLGMLSGTPENLRRDVARLIGDPELRERLAADAQTYLAQHFEMGLIAERYSSLFQELVAEHSA